MSFSQTNNDRHRTSIAALHIGDAAMVSRMRLVLACAMLLTVITDMPEESQTDRIVLFAFSGYVFHSVLVLVCTELKKRQFQGKRIHWLDTGWFAILLFVTGGAQSLFFLSFFFAILTTSLRWGFDEGAKATIAATSIVLAYGLMFQSDFDLPRVLLRATFLLAIGYMSAYWGESAITLLRRLQLLRDVTRLSNPRFGIDQTVNCLMAKIQAFFRADGCILILRDVESNSDLLRVFAHTRQGASIAPDRISPQAVAPLLALSEGCIATYVSASFPAMLFPAAAHYHDDKINKWISLDTATGSNVAEMLEANCYITAPVGFARSTGRIYVTARDRKFRKADATFLSHVVEQAFPVLENIETLDRMASDAALREREKLALDLHDSAVQPYIGLKLALSALRDKSASDNPLAEDIDKLLAMTTHVVSELRRYGKKVKETSIESGAALLVSLQKQTAHIKGMYGVHIDVSTEGQIRVSDRLAAEALQVVSEGLSNICKHTAAQRGSVNLQCADGRLRIRIGNEAVDQSTASFTPKSIKKRAEALGGQVRVQRERDGHTVVEVEIPV